MLIQYHKRLDIKQLFPINSGPQINQWAQRIIIKPLQYKRTLFSINLDISQLHTVVL